MFKYIFLTFFLGLFNVHYAMCDQINLAEALLNADPDKYKEISAHVLKRCQRILSN